MDGGMQRFLILLASAGAVGFAQAPNKCADLAKFQMPGARIEITSAEMVGAEPIMKVVRWRIRLSAHGEIQ